MRNLMLALLFLTGLSVLAEGCNNQHPTKQFGVEVLYECRGAIEHPQCKGAHWAVIDGGTVAVIYKDKDGQRLLAANITKEEAIKKAQDAHNIAIREGTNGKCY